MSDEPTSADFRDVARASPFLRLYAGAFPDLTATAGGEIGKTFERLGELVAGAPAAPPGAAPASLCFRIGAVDSTRAWTLTITEGRCDVAAGPADSAGLQVILAEDTWWEIAGGKILPLEAFGRGRMRVRGDIMLARWLIDAVARNR
ncbi:SCP2 sterol-binding domain-containing protein [Mangrovihabitans endophyticus]|nr:SCP2 sterol-binding domain-containing protein [Mangrovihabitans endophyticus]